MIATPGLDINRRGIGCVNAAARLPLAVDALLRVYDHVLLDAGTASNLSAELLTAQARAVMVPDALDG
jgi:hypothetical protein